MIETDTVRAINAAYPRLTLAEARESELPIELNQLKNAIERVTHPPVFQTEPADFRVALAALADERP